VAGESCSLVRKASKSVKSWWWRDEGSWVFTPGAIAGGLKFMSVLVRKEANFLREEVVRAMVLGGRTDLIR